MKKAFTSAVLAAPLCAALSACVPTVYNSQVADVGTAVADVAKAIPKKNDADGIPPSVARQAATISVLSGKKIVYTHDCNSKAADFRQSVIVSEHDTQENQDAVFARVGKLPACQLIGGSDEEVEPSPMSAVVAQEMPQPTAPATAVRHGRKKHVRQPTAVAAMAVSPQLRRPNQHLPSLYRQSRSPFHLTQLRPPTTSTLMSTRSMHTARR